MRLKFIIVFALLAFFLSGQSIDFYVEKMENYSVGDSLYIPNNSNYFLVLPEKPENIPNLKKFAREEQGYSINIHTPENGVYSFTPLTNHCMHPELQNQFPEIFAGKGYDKKTQAVIYFDYSPAFGFRAVINTPSEKLYIDPVNLDNHNLRTFYKRENLLRNANHACLVDADSMENYLSEMTNGAAENSNVFVENELNKYRIAVAATGEYTIFHGGTVNSALAAIVTTINRVNSVYETDAAITLELIPNNASIIFTNPSTDPYNNSSATQMINANPGVINGSIGFSNYDIGHVFSTGAGGLASLGSVCTTQKARGVTGIQSPINDPFDIDYVAHEIGHQFGARHTQNNSCNRSGQSAYEPFSASTIMGYAGICPPNLQSNSDDYFHHHSIREITNFAFNAAGNNCAAKVSTGNQAATITTSLASQYAPILTPFYLSASATDPEGDPLTYTWEQYDLGPANQSTTIDRGPVYRSFSPSTEGVQYFPRISTVLSGVNILGERLIFAPRRLNFRVTVRDNNPQGSAVSWSNVFFNTVGDEPFEILALNSGEGLYNRALNLITWDPGNTDEAPISCERINIWLSFDNGANFDQFLGTYANIGFAFVYLPSNTPTTAQGRLLFKADDGIFYQISERFDLWDNEVFSTKISDNFPLVIFPNPAQSKVSIKNLHPDSQNITFVDIAGQIIQKAQISTGQNEANLDVDRLSNGVYFIYIRDEKGSILQTKKLLVKK